MYPIAAGLIFIFFYFNVDLFGLTVDLLPDIAGYALVAWSAWRLRAKSYSFARALWLSAVLGVYTALAHLLAPTGLLGLVISALEAAGTVWLLTLLTNGVAEYEEAEKCSLCHAPLDRWRLLTVVTHIAAFVCQVALEFIPGVAFFSLLVVVLWFVFTVGFTVSFFRTASRWKHRDDGRGGGKKVIRGPLPPHMD